MNDDADATTLEHLEAGRHRTRLPRPCDVHTLFLFDVLAVVLATASIIGGLYLLQPRFANLFVKAPRPLELFVGNGFLLTITASLLAMTLVMALANVRYLVAIPNDYRLSGAVGILLALVNGIFIGYTLFIYYSDPGRLSVQLVPTFVVQVVLALVTLYYNAMLKAELLAAFYEQTTWIAISKLQELNETGKSSLVERDLIDGIRWRRKDELQWLDREWQSHLKQLRSAGRDKA